MIIGPVINIWEFFVKPRFENDFIQMNRPEGAWEQFFKGSAAFIDTALLKDEDAARRFLTGDRWKSEESFKRYIQQQEKYARLSQQNAQFCESTKHLGFRAYDGAKSGFVAMIHALRNDHPGHYTNIK